MCSSASVAVAQVANDEKIPLLVNISTADQIAGDAGPYAFQSSMQNRYSQQREAVLLEKDFKFESVAIVVENNDFGLTFRKNMVALMQKAGKKGRSRRHAGSQRHHWYATITRIPASRPDLVIVSIRQSRRRISSSNMPRPALPRHCSRTIRHRRAFSSRQVGAQAGKIGWCGRPSS